MVKIEVLNKAQTVARFKFGDDALFSILIESCKGEIAINVALIEMNCLNANSFAAVAMVAVIGQKFMGTRTYITSLMTARLQTQEYKVVKQKKKLSQFYAPSSLAPEEFYEKVAALAYVE